MDYGKMRNFIKRSDYYYYYYYANLDRILKGDPQYRVTNYLF